MNWSKVSEADFIKIKSYEALHDYLEMFDAQLNGGECSDVSLRCSPFYRGRARRDSASARFSLPFASQIGRVLPALKSLREGNGGLWAGLANLLRRSSPPRERQQNFSPLFMRSFAQFVALSAYEPSLHGK